MVESVALSDALPQVFILKNEYWVQDEKTRVTRSVDRIWTEYGGQGHPLFSLIGCINRIA